VLLATESDEDFGGTIRAINKIAIFQGICIATWDMKQGSEKGPSSLAECR